MKNSRKLPCIVNQFHGNFHSKTSSCSKIKPVCRDVKYASVHCGGLKGALPLTQFGNGDVLAVRGEKHDIPAASGD